MFDANEFFKKRFSEHLKETSRYLRYIFNEHIAFAMLFFVSALAFYYRQWLAVLPENFPVSWVIGIAFGMLASYSPVRTLLKEPDLVFLIAAENKLGKYFRNALLYSFVGQLYLILLVAAALGPLYFAAFPDRSGNTYLLVIVVLLIFKIWNLLANWWMLKVRESNIRLVDQLARVLLSIAVFYFIVKGEMVLAGVITGLFIIDFLHNYHMSQKQAGIAWELLVEKDQRRMQSFYRIANMFTDVPHLRNQVKKRHWLVSLVSRVPFGQKFVFDYLYRITFVRSGDYLGMYIRLIVIGGLFIYFVPNVWMKVIFALLFLYMSCFQMMTLYQHHRTVIWLDLYPVDGKWRQRALVKWLFSLMGMQTVLFTIVMLVQSAFTGAGVVLAGGFVFNYVFIKGYVERKLT